MRPGIPLTAVFIHSVSILLHAQDSVDFSSRDLQLIRERWARLQPVAEVILSSGDTVKGQALYFDRENLAVFPSDDLPLHAGSDILSLPLNDIDHVGLHRGGSLTQAIATGIALGSTAGTALGFAISGPGFAVLTGHIGGLSGGLLGKQVNTNLTVAELKLDSFYLDYPKELNKLQRWSVFEDSLQLTDQMDLLPVRSRAIRRAFQPRKFRVSFGMNLGINTLENSLRDFLESTELPPPKEFESGSTGLEYLDLSWRFRNRWIIGASLMANQEDLAKAYYFLDVPTQPGIRWYEYSVHLQETRMYLEFAPWPLEWYPAKRTELLVGAGMILSRATVGFWEENLMDVNPETGEWFSHEESPAIFGAQLRTSFHLYVFQTLSFSLGVEGNLYQNLEMPSLDLPAGEPGNTIELPSHALNYSTVRFKLGAHLYF
jgi:hypothetical protein